MPIIAQPILRTRAMVGEGALWYAPRQILYWVDITRQRVNVYDPATGLNESFDTGADVSTVVPHGPDKVMVTLPEGFAALNLRTRAIHYTAKINSDKSIRFNDGKCDPAGRFWAGTIAYDHRPGAATLFCLDAAGAVRPMIQHATNSNGIVWTSDHKTMYWIDTPTRAVAAFDYDMAGGGISNRRVAINVPPELGHPDGMAIDADDNLWVALYNGGGVACFDPRTGRILEKVETPGALQTTSCAFGGANLDQLYITTATERLKAADYQQQPEAGSLFRASLLVRGVPAAEFGG